MQKYQFKLQEMLIFQLTAGKNIERVLFQLTALDRLTNTGIYKILINLISPPQREEIKSHNYYRNSKVNTDIFFAEHCCH